MSNLPTVNWDVDPVFLQIPKGLALGIAGAIAIYSLIQGMRQKGSDHYVTALLFGVLGFVVYRFMGEGMELRYYSLLFVAVFLGGYSLLKWQIVRGGGRVEDAGDFIVYGVLGVLIGARLGHVIFYDLDKALADPMWVFKIWTGGLASHGAVLGLIFVMWLFCKRRGVPFLEGADRFAFSADLGATLVRVGNLMNSEIVGRETDQTWGFRFPRYDHTPNPPLRYPTQLAEIALGCLVMAGLFFADKKLGKEKRPRGALIATFFAIYFTGRFFVEFYKEYEGPITKGALLTMGQVLSIPGILIGWLGLYWALKKKIPVGWPASPDEEEEDRPRRPKRKKKKNKKRTKPVVEKGEDEARAESTDKPAAGEERDDRSKKGAEHDESDDEERDEPEDDEREDEERDDESDEDESDDDRESETGDEDESEDEDEDDEESDDERPKRTGDADVDEEFDEKGALKRRRD